MGKGTNVMLLLRMYSFRSGPTSHSNISFCVNILFGILQGPTAEFVAKYVDKGARVGVVGQLQIDTWNDKATGEARNRAKVIARDFDILETRAEADLRRTGTRGGSSFGMDEDDDESYSNAGSGGFFNNNGR